MSLRGTPALESAAKAVNTAYAGFWKQQLSEICKATGVDASALKAYQREWIRMDCNEIRYRRERTTAAEYWFVRQQHFFDAAVFRPMQAWFMARHGIEALVENSAEGC